MINKFYTMVWNINEDVKSAIKKVGDYTQLITPIAFLVYVACFGTNTLGIIFCVSFLVAMGIQILLKALFNNPRPRELEDGSTENPDLNLDWSVNEGDSFPSGHTMAAMAGGIFWFQIHPIIGVLGVALGLFTGFSRIAAKAHWLRDVLTSSVVSVIIYIVAILFFL